MTLSYKIMQINIDEISIVSNVQRKIELRFFNFEITFCSFFNLSALFLLCRITSAPTPGPTPTMMSSFQSYHSVTHIFIEKLCIIFLALRSTFLTFVCIRRNFKVIQEKQLHKVINNIHMEQ